MNSYGDYDAYRGAQDRAGKAGGPGEAGDGIAPGRAQVGRAQVGRAHIPSGPRHGPAGHGAGSASVGSASVGSASVGSASVGSASVGSASVGSGPVGRASVGRAGVPPVGPGGRGPGGRGPGGPVGPNSGGRGGLDPAALAARRKKARIRNLIIGAFAIFIMLAGGLVVGGTYYYDTVPLPDQLDLPEASTIYYSDGKTPIAKLGEEEGGNREYVKIAGIPQIVQDAVISAEDRNFYEHSGVDTKGIIRAAWNNLTGGDTQGASTITQQYARAAADLTGMTYARKVREAVIASKLNSNYEKSQILEYYLNIIYLGRGAYGIQAASRAYFDKSVDKLTAAEAAVLAALIKQPEASATHKGYDPTVNPEAAKERWSYVLNGMVEMGSISAEERAKIEYPKVLKQAKNKCDTEATCGIDTPVGNVVNYVSAELAEMGIQDLRKGGYRVVTSIDRKTQRAAENAARRQSKTSPLSKMKQKSLFAALVAIDPRNGQVRAYYGGEKGVGTDYAGLNSDGSGPHSPGSTFKIYTLAAALKDGISTQSHWDALILEDPDTGRPLTNAGRDTEARVPCANWCTLEKSAIESYNIPFYFVTKDIGKAKVMEAAKAAGIRTIKAPPESDKSLVDLTKETAAQAAKDFGPELGFGQYEITVLDHANGIATFANGGVYHKAHFVVKVMQRGDDGKYKVIKSAKEKGDRRFNEDHIRDLNAVLKQIPGHNGKALAGGRQAIGKTGTWQLGNTRENGDAWMIGATPQLASAVWLGTTGKRRAIKDNYGRNIGGGKLPAEIWKKFMDDALKGKKLETFPPAARTGDVNRGNGQKPVPKNPLDQMCLLNPELCETFRNDDDDDDDNNNGNGQRDGNNGPVIFPSLSPNG